MKIIVHPNWCLALLGFGVAGPQAARAQRPAPDSSKVYTFVARMPGYPGDRGYQRLLADLRREFGAASAAAGCGAPTFPVNVNLLVGPSGVVYRAEFVNNLRASSPTGMAGPARRPPTVATDPPGPALPTPCEAALAAAVRRLPRLQPGVQGGRPQTVRLTLPLVAKNEL